MDMKSVGSFYYDNFVSIYKNFNFVFFTINLIKKESLKPYKIWLKVESL